VLIGNYPSIAPTASSVHSDAGDGDAFSKAMSGIPDGGKDRFFANGDLSPPCRWFGSPIEKAIAVCGSRSEKVIVRN
jgi:hypothetical protein